MKEFAFFRYINELFVEKAQLEVTVRYVDFDRITIRDRHEVLSRNHSAKALEVFFFFMLPFQERLQRRLCRIQFC